MKYIVAVLIVWNLGITYQLTTSSVRVKETDSIENWHPRSVKKQIQSIHDNLRDTSNKASTCEIKIRELNKEVVGLRDEVAKNVQEIKRLKTLR